LEAPVEDAVVGSGEADGEGRPPCPAGDGGKPGRPWPGQFAEDPRGGEELPDTENHRCACKPGLQVESVAKEELEVALVRIDPLSRYQSNGERDQRERSERCHEPDRP